MKYINLLLIWCCIDTVAAAAKFRVIRRDLDQAWTDITDDSSYVLLRPRTNSKSKPGSNRNQRASSSASSSRSSNQRTGSSDAGPSSSRASAPAMSRDNPSSSVDPHEAARSALMFAAVKGDPLWTRPEFPKQRDSRSPSPPRSSVSGHPLSAIAIARGPATIETNDSSSEPRKKINVGKGEHGIANVRGHNEVSAGGHTFEGGAITVAVTGDLTGGTVEAKAGAKGYLINSRGATDHPPHEIKAGQTFQKAIHSINTEKENVATIAHLEGPGTLNVGAAQIKNDPSRKYRYIG